MIRLPDRIRVSIVAAMISLGCLVSADALASTINTNTSWTVTRPGVTETLRIVAYGDSIYAGWNGSISNVGRRAAPMVAGEYGAVQWDRRVEIVRRTKSGAIASDIFQNKIVNERSHMQVANTRMVTFEMCGNDYLQARSAFGSQTGTCNYTGLTNALNACVDYTERAMKYINGYTLAAGSPRTFVPSSTAGANANVKLKVVSNLFYPGWDADSQLTNCTDPESGQRMARRDRFLPLLATSNWTTCKLAEQNGFECVDSFADYMGSDYDSNGDGLIDAEALRYRSAESLDDYVQRITVELRSTIRDSRGSAQFGTFGKYLSDSESVMYLQSDDTHPTYYNPPGANLIMSATFLFGGTATGSGAATFADAEYAGGKNPQWNRLGHERMGQSIAIYFDLTVDAGLDATIMACETHSGDGSFQDRVFAGPWQRTISYEAGQSDTQQTSDTTFSLEHEYRAPGSHTLTVSVENMYNTEGSDTATITVLSALDAVNVLLARIEALRVSGVLKAGQASGLSQPLVNAAGKLQAGQPADAQNMINDFIREANLKAKLLGPEQLTELVAYAQRTNAAAACIP